MTDLDRITSEIVKVAQTEADSIVEQANLQAKEILEERDKELAQRKEKEILQSKQRRKDIIVQCEAGANQQYKQQMLAMKQEVIKETIEKAKESVAKLPTEEYFELFSRLAKEINGSGKAVLKLNETDLERVPQSFLQSFPKEVEIELSDKAVDIMGGFIVTFGEVTSNCSLEAIFADHYNTLLDKTQKILFSEQPQD